jgi:FeS assembly SUF system regulator
MMRLSRLADFAIVLMTHVAQDEREIHSAAEMAAATRLPAPTAAKVLARLSREGLLASVRGVKGGYRLQRPASAISIGTIIKAVDGPVALTQCLKPPLGTCEVEAVCPSRRGLHALNLAVEKALEDVSLADIAIPAATSRGSTPSSSVIAASPASEADQHRGSP